MMMITMVSVGTKTGYGELEGFFGGGRVAGSAIGVYYNNIMPNFSGAVDGAKYDANLNDLFWCIFKCKLRQMECFV